MPCASRVSAPGCGVIASPPECEQGCPLYGSRLLLVATRGTYSAPEIGAQGQVLRCQLFSCLLALRPQVQCLFVGSGRGTRELQDSAKPWNHPQAEGAKPWIHPRMCLPCTVCLLWGFLGCSPPSCRPPKTRTTRATSSRATPRHRPHATRRAGREPPPDPARGTLHTPVLGSRGQLRQDLIPRAFQRAAEATQRTQAAALRTTPTAGVQKGCVGSALLLSCISVCPAAAPWVRAPLLALAGLVAHRM